jgi:ribosomal protein S14
MNNTPRTPQKSSIFPENPEKSLFSVQTNQLTAIPCRLKNPCQGCGENQGIITEVDRSTGNPHSYRLECRECGRFQRWISQDEFDRSLNDQKGGRDDA